jgi:hypothetical protein
VLGDSASAPLSSDTPGESVAVTREVEEGVSSSGASDQQQQQGRAGQPSAAAQSARTPIVWDSGPAQPASTSPQRTLPRSIVSFCVL